MSDISCDIDTDLAVNISSCIQQHLHHGFVAADTGVHERSHSLQEEEEEEERQRVASTTRLRCSTLPPKAAGTSHDKLRPQSGTPLRPQTTAGRHGDATRRRESAGGTTCEKKLKYSRAGASPTALGSEEVAL